MYQMSEYLLNEIYTIDFTRIAPHWRLLTEYGGNQTIEEFRKSFNNISYIFNGVVYNPIAFIYKESYHL